MSYFGCKLPLEIGIHTLSRAELQQLLQDETERWWTRAVELYDLQVGPWECRAPDVSLNLRGVCAGRAAYSTIWYNPAIASANLEKFITRTVPHEVAHIVDRRLNGSSSHGPRWKKIMGDFGVPATRCHSYSNGVVKTRELKRFDYRCECRNHSVTSIVHNRMVRGQRRWCKICKQDLVPAEVKS
jgi:SprT protein